MVLKYENLSLEMSNRITRDKDCGTAPLLGFNETNAVRRNMAKDKANIIRTAFIRDIDKIIHCPYYNRYADKTQVFSFYKNDDITHRSLHVQLVSFLLLYALILMR